MLGNAIRLGVMGALALVDSMQVASNIPACVASDPRVMSLEAQWKMATGDAEGAYKVIRRADAARRPAPMHPNQARNVQHPTSTRS
jgi:hypothetical protein